MRKIVLIVAVVVMFALGLARPARASAPAVAAGTYMLTSRTLMPIGTTGGNSFFAVVETPAYDGGLTGTAVDTYTLIVHSDGSFIGHGTEACSSCTIGGRTGDYTAVFTFRGSGGVAAGTVTFTGGSGGLAGLHGGGGTFQGGPTGTYSYNYHFGP